MKLNKKILLALILCVTLLFIACNRENMAVQNSKSEESYIDENPESNKEPVPTFAKFTTVGLNKKEYNQDILKDKKLTVLNIWGTYCGSCVRELSNLAVLSEEYKNKDVQFIGIVVDTLDQNANYSDEIINIAKQLLEKSGVKYLTLLPSTDLIKAYIGEIKVIPQTLILDSKGEILKEISGAKSKEELKKIINDELALLK